MSWTWPRRTAAVYCLKVAAAALLGYLLAFGGPTYAMYSAFSAALIVGASRGEDTTSAANRVRGSIAGMVVGVALSFVPMPGALAVTLAIGATAYLCMGFGWGVPAARIGASLCAVTVLLHGRDAFQYDVMRNANTLIGIGAGLLVSYVVLPVRGRDAMKRSTRNALQAVSELLATMARPGGEPQLEQYVAVVQGMIEFEKAWRDARKEFGADADALEPTVRGVGLACIATLGAAIAHAEIRSGPGGAAAVLPSCERAGRLAERARSTAQQVTSASPASAAAPGPVDEVALHALALALRKVDDALTALGR